MLSILWLCSGGIFAANASEAIDLSPPSSVWNSERFPIFRAVLQTDAWFSSPAEYHGAFQPELLLAFASDARVLGIDLIHLGNVASSVDTIRADSSRIDSSRADSVQVGEIKLLRWRYNPLPMTSFVRRVPVLYFQMFGPEEDADPLRPAEPIEQYAYQEPDTSRRASVYASPFDSLLAAPTDSTERVKAFRYQLEDSPAPSVLDLPLSPYFIPRVGLTRTVELDSSGQIITISEKIGLYETRPALRLPLSDYKKLRERQSLRDNFQQLISPRTKAFVDPLQDLLGKITKITIAIPGGEGGFFSTLFGPPTVSLQVNGSIDIRASFQNEQSKDPTLATAGARNRTDPNFDQQVQMNITGAIGDKLTILADWNTQRQFDFENQLKLKYTGYTDEIIQSIEAGNVSLGLPTALIGSSQALFGVRANFQIAGLALSVVASQKRGKTETINVASGAQETTANLHAWQYEYNKHFFISNFYATNWEKAYNPNFINLVQTTDPQGRQLDQIEVWITPENSTQNPDARQAVALLNYADEVYSDTAFNSPDGFNFPDSTVVEGGLLPFFQTLRTSDSEASLAVLDPLGADRKYVGPFIKLKPEEYQFDAARGFVTVLRGIQPNQVIAVAYRYTKPGDTLRIGDFSLGNNNKRLILKMIKPQNLTNSNQGGWLLMLKNIYSLGAAGIKSEGFNLKMIYEQLGQEQPEIPFLPTDQSDSSRLIKLTGLDRFGVNNTPGVNGVTDNEFDYLRGVTIDELRGTIIFPFLRPFDKPIRARLTQLGITDTTRIKQLVYNEVYDNEPIGNNSASSQTLKDRYIIRANFRSDVRASYDLGVNVVQGSVRVYANSGLLTEGADYVVDYQLGQVT
ncbi:MAG: cell surface protein SprA, partial [Rhizobacter sp.]|nr:cell surface protein SprA [Chlorobiales bacterium]